MDDTETPLLNPRQAAERLGVAPRELYRLIDTGELVAYKVGRDLGLRPDDLDAYKAARPAP
jgi:excisionase family DNA binding protein